MSSFGTAASPASPCCAFAWLGSPPSPSVASDWSPRVCCLHLNASCCVPYCCQTRAVSCDLDCCCSTLDHAEAPYRSSPPFAWRHPVAKACRSRSISKSTRRLWLEQLLHRFDRVLTILVANVASKTLWRGSRRHFHLSSSIAAISPRTRI